MSQQPIYNYGQQPQAPQPAGQQAVIQGYQWKGQTQREINEQKRRKLLDVIAPPAIEVELDHVKLGDVLVRTLFVFSYPRFLAQNWMSPIINMDQTVDISIFIQPVSTEKILKQLQGRLTGIEAEMMEREEKGMIRDPVLDTAYRNIEDLRDKMQTAEEKMFQFGLYILIYGKTKEELDKTENSIRSILESRLVYVKQAVYQQGEGLR